MIVVTGASGQLGRLVIEELLKTEAAGTVVAAVRTPEKVSDFAARGVQVRQIDYTQPETMATAFAGSEKLLLISSNEMGSRTPQHANAITAAKKAGVQLIAYTSILRADSSPLELSGEHYETEKLLAESGVPYVLLRNGWYTENYAMSIPMFLQMGGMIGCAGDGKISSASRGDYAAAAAAVLTRAGQAGKVYELAGDEAYTLAEFAAAVSAASGKQVGYQNMPEEAYAGVLQENGLPGPVAQFLAQSETGVSQGGLFDDKKALSTLIGRPTTPWSETVRQVVESSK